MAQQSAGWSRSMAWNFLKSELAPYPGRGWLVARMTIAATILMLCIMTFRLPAAGLGAYYTLVISRDSSHATLDGVVTIFIAISLALTEILVGAVLFAASPVLHFLWVVAALFSVFFLISAATRYNFATSFGFLVITAIPFWDFPGSVDTSLSTTLYAALAVTSGAVITMLVEMFFAAVSGSDLLQDGIDARLRVVAQFLSNVHSPGAQVKAKLTQYADIGMGQLRRFLIRSEGGSEDYARKAVLIGLTGRLVDLCAGVLASNPSFSIDEQQRLGEIAARIDLICRCGPLSGGRLENPARLSAPGAGFVELLESTVQLMNDALEQPALMEEYTAKEDVARVPLLKRDAFTNPEHLKFALRGTCAALLCFVAYHLLDWRGLFNSMATCMVTALSTSGSSRQKQLLRILGAITGGLLFAMTSEVFLLPHLDSIAGFSLFFAAVTMVAAWFATASPRLSYYGLQIALAFDLIQLRTFAPDTQLTPARDNVAGILLGLLAMWLVFDQLTTYNSLLAMRGALVRGIRGLTAYMREPAEQSRTEYLKRVRAYRDAVNESFLEVRSSADAVLFEFDRNRPEALKLRDEVRAWQPQLRTLFLLQITLAHMRLREPGTALPAPVERILLRSADQLDLIVGLLDNGRLSGSRQAAEGPDREPLPATDAQLSSGGNVAEKLAADSATIVEDLLRQVRSASVASFAILFLLAAASLAASPRHQFFRIVIGNRIAGPVSGRLLLFMAPGAEGRENLQPDEFSSGDVYVAAKEIRDALPGSAIELDADDIAYPAALSNAPADDYRAQVLLDVAHSYSYSGRQPGDLTSDVTPLPHFAPGNGVEPQFTLSKVLPETPPPALPAGAHQEDFVSPALTEFYHRPITMHAVVVEPPSYAGHPAQRYPACYYTLGFTGTLDILRKESTLFSERMRNGKLPPMFWILLDEALPTGTHEFADSANNGPWGRALTTEFIPYLESRYRLDRRGGARFLNGHSSGGWATLWLQVTYPKVFGGTWSTSPDSSDFHDFSGIDLYAPHANVYRKPDGSLYPIVRGADRKVLATVEQMAREEEVIGPVGGQFSSFEWVFSPRGPDGRPLPMFERGTGEVNSAVVEAWRRYDIVAKLRAEWPTEGRNLTGKIHVYVGTVDTFYLDGAAHKLDEALSSLDAKASVTFLPGRTHMDVYQVGDDPNGLFSEIARQMYAEWRASAKAPS